MKRSLSGRADLLQALAYGDPGLSAAMAELLGYNSHAPLIPEREPTLSLPELPSLSPKDASKPTDLDTPYQLVDVPFWRLQRFEAVAPVDKDGQRTPSFADLGWRKRPSETQPFTPLAPQHAVLTELRKIPAIRRITNDIDVDAVVERVGRGEMLDQIPYRQRRSWGSSIYIVEDRARRLVPYWLDQEYLVTALKSLYPPSGVTIARIGEGDNLPVIRWPEEQRGQAVFPSPEAIVLVLGDLGCLADQGEHVRRWWLQWGRQLHDQGTPTVAIVPAKTTDMSPEIVRTWTIVRWGAVAETGVDNDLHAATNTVQRLLTLLSPAIRLEPGLLRAVRGLLPEGRNDPGLEARVWQDAAIASQHSVAASWDPEQRKAYLEDFAQLPPPLRSVVLDLIRTWRANLHQTVWFEEIVGLDPQSRKLLDVVDLEDALTFLPTFADTLFQAGQLPSGTAAWIGRLLERLPDAACNDRRVRRMASIFFHLVQPHAAATQAPSWYDPAIKRSSDLPVRQVELWQQADRLVVRAVPPSSFAASFSAPRGSPLGVAHTASGEILIAPGAEVSESNAFWQTGQPPLWAQRQEEPAQTATRRPPALLLDLSQRLSITIEVPDAASFSVNTDRDRLQFIRETKPEWASEIGRDKFGLWAAFEIASVRQQLRWIPPGRFWMGSPDNEEGRFEDEGPRHEVQLTHGFWLFDTPCTQALWQAVMKNNPSYFKGKEGKERPVEQVSWEDCQQFIGKLNANPQLPGLALALPTEAEWEYACRAGTNTARYADDLDTIWYRENSKDETHPVKQRQPNTWGLYDMLGNVDEWCHDGLRDYTTDTVVDPLGPRTAGADRVIRGGHWDWDARLVRSAYRYALPPGDRYDDLGFRCASSGQVSRLGSEPSGDGQRQGARAVGDPATPPRPGKRDLRRG
jgi:formylglycine-generating enzyme required for sulfatase activity